MTVRLDATGREGYNSPKWGIVEDGNAFAGANISLAAIMENGRWKGRCAQFHGHSHHVA